MNKGGCMLQVINTAKFQSLVILYHTVSEKNIASIAPKKYGKKEIFFISFSPLAVLFVDKIIKA